MQMKKLISIVLVLMMLVSLCACEQMEKLQGVELPEPPKAEVTAEPDATAQEEPEQPAEELSVLSEEPSARVIVNVRKTSEEHFDPAEGKQLILDFSYETPFVDISDRDAASNAINEYIAMLDETYCTGNDYGDGSGDGLNMLLEIAIDNFTYAYETGSDVNLEMSSNRTVSVERADDGVLSLLYYTYTYTGGDHGNYNYRAYVFDTKDGSLVSLDMLAADSNSFKKSVYALVKEHAADITDETLTGILKDGAWYLGENGFMIIADGENALDLIEIPYAELKGILDKKWMPRAYEGEGELGVILQRDFADGSMEVIDKIIADEHGEELCLIASGLVRNVRISKVSYTDYTGKFYETEQLWNCSDMKDCAVQLQTDIPDGMPNLLISYCTLDGQKINRLLSQSGEDGSLILVEDDIAAVG